MAKPHPHGSSSETEGGSTPHHHGGGSSVRPAGSVNDVHEMSSEALQASRPGGNGYRPALPAGRTPKALTPGRTSKTLAQIRAARSGPSRGAIGEEYARELYGAGPERHFPVTPNNDPDFPVTTPGGRKVDAPVDEPNGNVTAIEVKHYKDWKTVTLPDGSKESQPATVPLNGHLREEIAKDVAKRAEDPSYDPRWVFLQAGPGPELRQKLKDANIIFVEYG